MEIENANKISSLEENEPIKFELTRDLEDIFISAIRYSIGRQTYMPSLVIDYINPKLQFLSSRFLEVVKKDIEDQAIYGGKNPYGDPKIDKPLWDRFYQNVVDEINERNQFKGIL